MSVREVVGAYRQISLLEFGMGGEVVVSPGIAVVLH